MKLQQTCHYSILSILFHRHPASLSLEEIRSNCGPISMEEVAVAIEELRDIELLTSVTTLFRLTEKGLIFAREVASRPGTGLPVGDKGESSGSPSNSATSLCWPEQLADVLDEESSNRRGRFLEIYREQLEEVLA